MRAQNASLELEKPVHLRHLRTTLLFTLLLLCAPVTPAEERPTGNDQATPSLVVQVKCHPGGRSRWLEAFETHLAPALQEAAAREEIRAFTFLEAIVPGQPYDFMLVLNAQSFAFFDRRRPFPHWAALFRQVGVEEGRRVLAHMQELESEVSVSLLRSYGALP